MNEGVGDDTDLSAPLLDENDGGGDGGSGNDIGIDYFRSDRITGGSSAADSEAAAVQARQAWCSWECCFQENETSLLWGTCLDGAV